MQDDTDVIVESVNFLSEGIRCAADLYRPARMAGKPAPALVLATGFAGVKESSADAARFFAASGYVALAIDYRSFGNSDGEPRGQAFPLRQAEDVRSAITYLETRQDVDPARIGIWGTSYGGGIALYAGAVDRRAKIVISQIPVVDGRLWHQTLRTSEQYTQLLDALDEDRRQRFRGAPSRRIPVTAHGATGGFAAMPADAEIVGLLDPAHAAPSWSPTVTLESVEKIIEYSPEAMIDRIAPRPLMIVTVSGYDIIHPVADVLRAYDRAREPKEIVILPYTQLGLYGGAGLAEALAHQLRFLQRHLPAASA